MKDKIFEMLLNDDKKYYTNPYVRQILKIKKMNLQIIETHTKKKLQYIIPNIVVFDLKEEIDKYEDLIQLLNSFNNGKTIKEFYENEKKEYLQDELGCIGIEELKINIVNSVLKEYISPYKSK